MVAALKEGDEAFLCGGKPGLTEEEEEEPLREALIMKALELAREAVMEKLAAAGFSL